MTNITLLAHNRPRLTEQALKSLFDHTDRKTFTLTLLDDCSTDFRTTRLLERYASDYKNVALISLKNSRGITGQARNLVVYWSEQYFGAGDWLYLSDNDVWFSPGWLEKLTNAAAFSEDSGFVLWGGQVHPYHQPSGEPFQYHDIEPGQFKRGDDLRLREPVTLLTQHAMLDGPSWLMRWDTWRKYGPLEAHSKGVCQGEDVTFCQAITADGCRIGVISPHVVAHTGIRQSNGNLAPGADVRLQNAFPGVIYE